MWKKGKGENKKDDREARGAEWAIRSDGMDPKGRETASLTVSFCKPHKQRTARGSSSDWSLFGDDERWKRRSPLRENRNYV